MDKRVKEIIEEAKRIAFFGGAGVSTESNIPDFRSETGLYKAKNTYGYSPEEMLSHSFFMNNTKTFFDYYKHYLIYKDAKPNRAHIALAKLEELGKINGVSTQNIDGLHQMAGSKKVFELHGSVLRNFCMKCHKSYDLDFVMDEGNCKDQIPICNVCGEIVKPDVVLYEEMLDDNVINSAVNSIKNADTLIVGGTSLNVYPAAGLIRYFKGKNLILINREKTSYDSYATLVIHESIGDVLDMED